MTRIDGPAIETTPPITRPEYQHPTRPIIKLAITAVEVAALAAAISASIALRERPNAAALDPPLSGKVNDYNPTSVEAHDTYAKPAGLWFASCDVTIGGLQAGIDGETRIIGFSCGGTLLHEDVDTEAKNRFHLP